MTLLLLLACSATDPLTTDDTGDTGATDDTGGGATLGPGALVITEFMNDPAEVDGDFGEWFEVWNATASTLDLAGVEIADDDGVGFVVAGSLPVAAGGWVVFGASSDTRVNGGAPVDYAYDIELVKLGNEDDAIILRAGGEVVDMVAYDPADGFPVEEGSAVSLSPGATTAEANDLAASWCLATSTYGDGDHGTPGAANTACD